MCLDSARIFFKKRAYSHCIDVDCIIANLFLHAFLSNILVMKKLFPPQAWSYIAEDVIMGNFHFKSISTKYRFRKRSLIVVCSLRVMTEMGSRLWESLDRTYRLSEPDKQNGYVPPRGHSK